MRLYTIPNDKDCEEVLATIKDSNIEVVELKKNGEQWVNDTIVFPHGDRGFPVLMVGEDANLKPNYLVGKEGIISFLEEGYVYAPDTKYCPYEKGDCRKRDCIKFTVLWKGIIPEGGCSDYWQPILLVELISKINKE